MKINVLTSALAGTLLMFCTVSASAETTSDLFQKAYTALQKADVMRDSDKVTEAISLYEDTIRQYDNLASKYPDIEAAIVKFRITYCQTQIEELKKMEIGDKEDKPKTAAMPQRDDDTRSSQEKADDSLSEIKAKALAFIKTGQTDLAISTLVKAMGEAPDDSSIRVLIATAQCKAGRYDDAVKLMTSVIEEDGNVTGAYMVLATAYFGQGKFKESQKALKQATKLDGNLKEGFFDLAKVTLLVQPIDTESARKYYKKYIELGGKKDPSLDFLLK